MGENNGGRNPGRHVVQRGGVPAVAVVKPAPQPQEARPTCKLSSTELLGLIEHKVRRRSNTDLQVTFEVVPENMPLQMTPSTMPVARNIAHTLRRTPKQGIEPIVIPAAAVAEVAPVVPAAVPEVIEEPTTVEPAAAEAVARRSSHTDAVIHVSSPQPRSKARDVMFGAAIGFVMLVGVWFAVSSL